MLGEGLEGGLVAVLRLDELAVQASDVRYGYVLRAFHFALARIGTVAESEFVHFGEHRFSAPSRFGFTLWQQGELAYLGTNEKHCGAVLTGGSAGTTADAGGGIHSFLSFMLGNGNGVGIGHPTGVDRYVTAGLDNLVVSRAIHHKVANDGESGTAPRLNSDYIAIVKVPHMQLTGGDAGIGSVRMPVDIERAHTAYTFTAIVVVCHRILILADQLLVEYVDHFEERSALGNLFELISLKVTTFFGSLLPPYLYGDIYIFIHNGSKCVLISSYNCVSGVR